MDTKKPLSHFWLRFGTLLLLLVISFIIWHFSYRPDSFLRQFSGGLQFLGYTFFAIVAYGVFLLVEMIVLFTKKNKKAAFSNLIVLITQVPLFIILLKLIE